MPSPRLLLSGFFGFANLGDEAIFEAMVGSLRQACPDVQLTALVADPSRAEKLGVKTVRRKHLPSVAQAILKSDLVVSGGGGLVQDSTGVGSVVYYLGITRLAHLMGKPTMFYAQGFGPVRTPLGLKIVRWWANSLTLVTLRDEESMKDMRAAGVTRPPFFVTADPALMLEPAPPAEMAARLKEAGLTGEIARLEGPTGRHSETGPLVAVTIRPWHSLRFDEVAGALRRFHEEEKARYLILPFHPELDRELSVKLHEQLSDCSRLVGEHWTPAETTGLLRCCDLIVGMRLHSLILAAGACIPSLGLSYDPKVERFARLAGAVPMVLEEVSTDRLLTALKSLLNGRQAARKMMEARVELLREKARRTARAAIALAGPGRLEAALQELRE